MADKVLDPKKDALIAFTAEWCGYCRAFAPTWAAIEIAFGKKLQTLNLDETEFSLALERDAVLKQAHSLFRGYPTIVFYKAPAKGQKKGEVSRYEESRELGDIVPAIAKIAGLKGIKIPEMKEEVQEVVVFGMRIPRIGGSSSASVSRKSPKRRVAAAKSPKRRVARKSPKKKQAGGIMSSRISLPSGAFA